MSHILCNLQSLDHIHFSSVYFHWLVFRGIAIPQLHPTVKQCYDNKIRKTENARRVHLLLHFNNTHTTTLMLCCCGFPGGQREYHSDEARTGALNESLKSSRCGELDEQDNKDLTTHYEMCFSQFFFKKRFYLKSWMECKKKPCDMERWTLTLPSADIAIRMIPCSLTLKKKWPKCTFFIMCSPQPNPMGPLHCWSMCSGSAGCLEEIQKGLQQMDKSGTSLHSHSTNREER